MDVELVGHLRGGASSLTLPTPDSAAETRFEVPRSSLDSLLLIYRLLGPAVMLGLAAIIGQILWRVLAANRFSEPAALMGILFLVVGLFTFGISGFSWGRWALRNYRSGTRLDAWAPDENGDINVMADGSVGAMLHLFSGGVLSVIALSLRNPWLGLAGGVLLLGGVLYAWQWYRIVQLRKTHPILQRAPWLASPAWRNRRIVDGGNSRRNQRAILALFGVIAVLVVTPMIVMLVRRHDAAPIGLVVILVWSATFIWYLRRLSQRLHVGRAICHLHSLPAWIGDVLAVEIEVERGAPILEKTATPQSGFNIELQNLSPVGRHLRLNYQTGCTLDAAQARSSGDGSMRLPITIPIPENCRPWLPSRDSSFWRLSVSLPGIAAPLRFPVPVADRGMQTADSTACVANFNVTDHKRPPKS